MKKDSLYRKMLLTAILPVLAFGIVITVFCYNRFRNTIYNESRENMLTTARSLLVAYDLAYPGDYSICPGKGNTYDLLKGDVIITEDYSIVDRFRESSGTDISLLYLDMRVHTTFATDQGQRLAGVYANSETSASVLSDGEVTFYNDIKILGEQYLVLYIPIYNSDESIIGMTEVAKATASLKRSVWRSVWPVLLLAIPGMIVAAWFSYKKTKEITGTLSSLQGFLNKVSSGNLAAELDTKCFQRHDELGEISRASIQMQKSIRGFVETDQLTGLYNRRYIHFAMGRINAKAKETGLPYSLAITDIDFFKKVNDTYGHNAGDEVLKAVAAQLKYVIQGKGFAARWGGEEFILVFDKQPVEGALPTIEDLQSRIRNMVVKTEGYEISVTLTIGVVTGDTDKDVEQLVEGADELLYYGKEHGRNQIVTKEIINQSTEKEGL